ncbi:MAG: class I SAM-dependent methyltransferase [Planctomycetales bacterium]
MSEKMSVQEIEARFDNEVERFSNLETGQVAITDARLMLDLLTEAASCVNPDAKEVCDIGCGAGNYTLRLLQRIPNFNVTLIDLSKAMLEKAEERVAPETAGTVKILQGDMREVELGENRFDILMAAATLHHLRTDAEWEAMFRKIYASLKPGGSFWVCDLIEQQHPVLQEKMWDHWGKYLTAFKGPEYRETVFDYVRKEDTPKPLTFQLNLLSQVGFESIEILHKVNVFAAFGAIKGR